MIKEVSSKLTYKGKDYKLVFNLNVMEKIQDAYGTLDKWGELTDGSEREVNIKALVFGITEMINEAIDIDNDDKEITAAEAVCDVRPEWNPDMYNTFTGRNKVRLV